jgi:hypothetical protein
MFIGYKRFFNMLKISKSRQFIWGACASLLVMGGSYVVSLPFANPAAAAEPEERQEAAENFRTYIDSVRNSLTEAKDLEKQLMTEKLTDFVELFAVACKHLSCSERRSLLKDAGLNNLENLGHDKSTWVTQHRVDDIAKAINLVNSSTNEYEKNIFCARLAAFKCTLKKSASGYSVKLLKDPLAFNDQNNGPKDKTELEHIFPLIPYMNWKFSKSRGKTVLKLNGQHVQEQDKCVIYHWFLQEGTVTTQKLMNKLKEIQFDAFLKTLNPNGDWQNKWIMPVSDDQEFASQPGSSTPAAGQPTGATPTTALASQPGSSTPAAGQPTGATPTTALASQPGSSTPAAGGQPTEIDTKGLSKEKIVALIKSSSLNC